MINSFAADLAAIADIRAVSKLLEVACRTTGMGFAAIARVTPERWIALAVRDEIGFGLTPGGELQVKTTICDEIRQSGQLVVIDHVEEDDLFRNHHTPRAYGFQSYISVPLVLADGRFFGTLCAIDPKPAKVSRAETVGMFQLFAELIAMHLDARKRLAASEATLLDERATSALRDQFIAVLGHDLRNPLASIDAGAKLMAKSGVSGKGAEFVAHIQKSVERMNALIGNVLDFARGQLGGGIAVTLTPHDLGPVLEHVVSEVRLASPHARIESVIDINDPVACDPSRIGQLLSNLLANAVTHGDADAPIVVRAHLGGEALTISVENGGSPIPPETMPLLFRPFTRADGRAGQQGLGLGLYIACEVAKAHGGRINARSDAASTRFVFTMPLRPSNSVGAGAPTEGAGCEPSKTC